MLGVELNIRSQHNRWSCVAASFATLLDLELDYLLQLVGHDGSQIIFEDLEEPRCRRAFQVQEIAMAIWPLGYIVGSYDFEPFGLTDEEHVFSINYPDPDALFKNLLESSVGIICGRIKGTDRTHAVAWNGKQVYDPLGFIYPNYDRYEIYSYHPVQQRPTSSV